MSADLFPAYVVGFAVIVIALMAAWVFLISCMDLMRGAWEAMKGREWRWPEGPLRGPGDYSLHARKERQP